MSYSQFNLLKVKQSFGLTTVENVRFLPVLEPVAVSEFLTGYLLKADTRLSCHGMHLFRG